MQWMSVSRKVDTSMAKENNDGGGTQKRCEMHTSMRTIIGERKPNDRYDVRSRDCHAMNAHMSYGKLSNGTSGVHPTCFLKKT